TADVRRDVSGDVTDALVEHEPTAAVRSTGVLGEARTEPVVERQDFVGFGLTPPLRDHLPQPLRLVGSEIDGLGEVAIQTVELPSVLLEVRARRVVGDRLPAVTPQAPVAE